MSADLKACLKDFMVGIRLEAWGYRLKCFKGDYGKGHEGSWDTYTPEMLDYCIQDTQVTVI